MTVTGEIRLNENRAAHISSTIPGIIETVSVDIGADELTLHRIYVPLIHATGAEYQSKLWWCTGCTRTTALAAA